MEICCRSCQEEDMREPVPSCDSCGASSDEATLTMCDVLLCEDCHPTECSGECA